MISKITIHGFQSHKDTTLNLSEGVNCIVGSSDVGKTAIIRALRWLVWNRPSGDAFRSYWGGDTAVSITLDDQLQVERVKGPKENAYWLNKAKFSAMGTDVPDVISKALNFNEINLQQQFDRPFLLDNTAGEVASHWNRVAQLDVIDTALRNVQSWLRKLEQDIVVDEQNVAELTVALGDYVDLDKLEVRVAALERLQNAMLIELGNIKRLEQIVSHIAITDAAIAQHDQLIQLDATVTNLQTLTGAKSNLQKRLDGLDNLVYRITSNNDDIKRAEGAATQLMQEFERNFPAICPLCGKPK